MNTVAIVQARMGSTRLPGKILKPLAGNPALWHLIERLRYSKRLQDIVIATTVNGEDDIVVELCKENQVKWFRGSENDVLDRYYQAAKAYDADPIVRITADCPVIDPVIVDEVIEGFFQGQYDVYGLGGEFPDGLDCVLYSFRVLEDLWKNTELPSDREHVGATYIKNHTEKYKIGTYEKFKGLSHHRWTLDEEADLLFLQAIYDRIYRQGQIFATQDILDLLEREPHLMEINSGIVRNEGYLKSLKEDERFLQDEKS
jgi:spore coat polysaccharide biosynthesis protein SpsF